MLDVDRRYDGDAGVQQVDYVFVALAVFRTRNVRVGQLIDDGDGGAPRYHRIEIHLFDHDTFVLDTAHGNAFQIANQRSGLMTTMRLNDADDDVHAFSLELIGVLQHLVRLP